MQYTEQELSQLIKNLETEFSAHIADIAGSTVPASLAKAEDESADESKDKPAESKEAKPEESKEEKPKDAPAAESKEAAPNAEAAPAVPAEGEQAPAAAAEDASGYDAEDIAHMDQMYMSMSKAELLAHHDSCVRALDAQGAEHVHGAPNAQASVAPEATVAAPSEIDKCGDMTMMNKSENAELELAKSDAAAAKAKNAELEKNLAGVQDFLTQLVKKVPQGKAITQYEQVAKSESVSAEEKTLSKSEITSILMKKAAEPTLSKSDRDAINAFYLNAQPDLKTISHLLK